MNTSDIIPGWLDHLDSLEKDERVETIDDLIHRLNFERRLTLLTPKQVEHMSCTLSPPQRDRLDKCKTEEDCEEVINGYARANYFRQLAWADYLNGVTADAPLRSERESKITPEEVDEILEASRKNVKELQKTLDRVFCMPDGNVRLR